MLMYEDDFTNKVSALKIKTHAQLIFNCFAYILDIPYSTIY